MRKSRGRNEFTKAGLGRLIDVGRLKRVPQLTLELPGRNRAVFLLSQDNQEPSQKNERDEELYGKNSPPVRK